MDDRNFYNILLWAWMALAGVIFLVLLRRPAPYGRLARPGWGPVWPARLGWLVMECPAVLTVAFLFAIGSRRSAAAWAFLAVWNVHYVYRSLVYPALIRGGRPVPVFVVASGFVFNVVNGYLQGRHLFALAPAYDDSWLAGGRFWGGLALFAAGLAVNIRSDSLLRSLRRRAGCAYVVPRGWLFTWVSCPNYLGEIVEWIGWAILTWSLGGLAFAIWTAANLIPRALACHRWYGQTFPDYPPGRKALIPCLL